MTKENITQLVKTLDSAGYKITKFYNSSSYLPGEFTVKLLLRKKIWSNNEIIKLADALFSIGFEITKYDSIRVRGNIKLTLVSLMMRLNF
jgi:hypothetical protein